MKHRTTRDLELANLLWHGSAYAISKRLRELKAEGYTRVITESEPYNDTHVCIEYYSTGNGHRYTTIISK